MTKTATKKSRKSVDAKVKPPGAATVLQAITDATQEIEEAELTLAGMYDDRAQLYERAREMGATRPQIADAAGLSLSAIKYTRAKSA